MIKIGNRNRGPMQISRVLWNSFPVVYSKLFNKWSLSNISINFTAWTISFLNRPLHWKKKNWFRMSIRYTAWNASVFRYFGRHTNGWGDSSLYHPGVYGVYHCGLSLSKAYVYVLNFWNRMIIPDAFFKYQAPFYCFDRRSKTRWAFAQQRTFFLRFLHWKLFLGTKNVWTLQKALHRWMLKTI